MNRCASVFGWAVLLCLWMTPTAKALDYTVQVGAFLEPSQEFIDTAAGHGELVLETNPEGLIVISIGRFWRRQAALDLLNQISESYPGAYVRPVAGAAVPPWKPEAN